jgi:hypothetical protein
MFRLDLEFFDDGLDEILDPASWNEGRYYYVKKQYSLNEYEVFFAMYTGSKICPYITYLNAQIVNHYFDDYKLFIKLKHENSYGSIVDYREVIPINRIPIHVPYTFYRNAELHNALFSVKCYDRKRMDLVLQNEILVYSLVHCLDALECKTHIPWLVWYQGIGSFLMKPTPPLRCRKLNNSFAKKSTI